MPPPPHVARPSRPTPPVPASSEPMRVELTQKVSFTDALGNPSTDEPGSHPACCHSQTSEVGPLYTLQAGGQSGNKDPKALFEEPYDKGDLEFAMEHRAHVGKGYMVDIKVWTWVQDMGIPPYGNSKEAINDVNSTGSFRYTMSCQTVDTLDEDMMEAFKPDFTGAREDVQRLIPHTVMLEIEGKISNENEDKATVNRNWSAEYMVWDRRQQLKKNERYMVIDRHHVTHQTHCGDHFECQWTIPHHAPDVDQSVLVRRDENGMFVAGSSPMTVAEEVLFKDKQVSLTSAATFVAYRAMESKCKVGYIQADEDCIVLAPVKDNAAKARVYKLLKDMQLATLTRGPMTNEQNEVAAAPIIKQKRSPVTESVNLETPGGGAAFPTCAEIKNQLHYCDSVCPCSNFPELGAPGVPSRTSWFPTGLAEQKRIRFV